MYVAKQRGVKGATEAVYPSADRCREGQTLVPAMTER